MSEGSPYRVIRDESAVCQCGKRSVSLLTSGESWLPAFYVCGACGYVGQVGAGRVKGRIAVAPGDDAGEETR